MEGQRDIRREIERERDTIISTISQISKMKSISQIKKGKQ